MNETVKRHLISAGITFASVFLTTLGAQVALVGQTDVSYAVVVGAILIAGRAAVKAAFEGAVSFGNKLVGK